MHDQMSGYKRLRRDHQVTINPISLRFGGIHYILDFRKKPAQNHLKMISILGRTSQIGGTMQTRNGKAQTNVRQRI